MRFGYGVGDYGKSDSWDEMLMKYKTHYMTEEKLMSYVSSDPIIQIVTVVMKDRLTE
jgi:hypothetical protein